MELLRTAVAAWIAGALLLVGILPPALLPPGWRFSLDSAFTFDQRGSGSRNQRACLANRRVLAGALEAYALETCKTAIAARSPGRPTRLAELPRELARDLVNKGLLACQPDDPGCGRDTFRHYLILDVEPGVFCAVHGCELPGTPPELPHSPRDQLIALGVSDSSMLELASEATFPHRQWCVSIPEEILYAAALLLLAALARARRLHHQLDLCFWSVAAGLLMPAAGLALMGDGRLGALALAGLLAVHALALLGRAAYVSVVLGAVPSVLTIRFLPRERFGRSARTCASPPGTLSLPEAAARPLAESARERLLAAKGVALAMGPCALASVAGWHVPAMAGWSSGWAVLLGIQWGVARFWRDVAMLPGSAGKTRTRILTLVPGATALFLAFSSWTEDGALGAALMGLALLATSLSEAMHHRWLLADLERATTPVHTIASRSQPVPLRAPEPIGKPMPRLPSAQAIGVCLQTQSIRLGPGTACRVCGDSLFGGVVLCERCETPHHEACWQYNRGCAVFGCDGDRVAQKRA
ncbi:MAG: hypothetical protein HY303_08710, partial [Candidatus Wallbacteria bacterium]|nr:hypothetical protein [Candidatus Wallbacteria bacterium]